MTISVIIPSSKDHLKYLPDAIASVKHNGFDAEIVIVNDSDEEVPDSIKGEGKGPAKARNLGAKHAKGECLVFLDADDMLVPGALEVLWQEYQKTGGIVYGDMVASDGLLHVMPEPYCGNDIRETSLYKPKRPNTCLIPKKVHEAVGGFDEDIPFREDVDYEIRTEIAGYCHTKVNYPVYYYRVHTGTRRVVDRTTSRKTVDNYLYNKYKDYFTGEKRMACAGCRDKKPRSTPVREAKSNEILDALNQGLVVEMEYIFPEKATREFEGPVTGKRYRFGDNKRDRVKYVGNNKGQVDPEDAVIFLGQRMRNYSLFAVNYKEPSAVPKEVVEPKPEVKASIENVEKYTIGEMKGLLEKSSFPKRRIELWLEQEQNHPKPRKGMIDALESYLEFFG